ncbi:MAG: hypothetical protein ABIS36_13140 [Chryseolinea sp.]
MNPTEAEGLFSGIEEFVRPKGVAFPLALVSSTTRPQRYLMPVNQPYEPHMMVGQ